MGELGQDWSTEGQEEAGPPPTLSCLERLASAETANRSELCLGAAGRAGLPSGEILPELKLASGVGGRAAGVTLEMPCTPKVRR